MNLKNQKNIEIIGLNYKDDFNNAKNFLNELGSPYKLILLDKDGTIAIEWGAYGVPESFLIFNNASLLFLALSKILSPSFIRVSHPITL